MGSLESDSHVNAPQMLQQSQIAHRFVLGSAFRCLMVQPSWVAISLQSCPRDERAAVREAIWYQQQKDFAKSAGVQIQIPD